jgi:acyl-CoA synthetase (AMP-forming)/AMP-acid ligase II
MFESLPEILTRRAAGAPDARAFVFLDDRGDEVAELSYRGLREQALAVAELLTARCDPGDRALLLFPSGLDFIVAYFGCLYANVVAVPINPPRHGRVQDATRGIVADCEPALVLSVAELIEQAGPLLPVDAWLAVDGIEGNAHGFDPMPPDPDQIAFLQYTSGSTSAPKGVMVSHDNLVANQRMIRDAFGHDEHSTVIAWAPLFHDQGLIGNVLQPLYVGATSILMAPLTFIRRPLLWLEAISRYRAHTSGGPNFAFEAAVLHAMRGGIPDIDLSCWKVAFNGAEPIRHQTLENFAKTFAPYGFGADALYPCYGLAEATLLVTGSEKGRGAKTFDADTEALRDGELVAATTEGRTLTGSGRVAGDSDVRIVDPATGAPSPPHRLGEVWISGRHVAQGYWRKQEATAATFHAELDGRRYLRSGDLGQFVDGELYIAGRLKDLIIVRGRNYYPQDIECAAQSSHPALLLGACAAFAVASAAGERLVVVQEIRRTDLAGVDAADIVQSIRAAIVAEHELSVADVVLTVPGQLQKTSSGKIMRSAAKLRYLGGGFEPWSP